MLTYQPALVPNGFLAVPEFEILDSVRTNATANRFRVEVVNEAVEFTIASATDSARRLRYELDFEAETALLPAAPVQGDPGVDDLLQSLDLLLCHGTLSDDTKSIIREEVSQFPNLLQLDRAKAILLCVLTSADCAVGE